VIIYIVTFVCRLFLQSGQCVDDKVTGRAAEACVMVPVILGTLQLLSFKREGTCQNHPLASLNSAVQNLNRERSGIAG
jgi:hypothetical protein